MHSTLDTDFSRQTASSQAAFHTPVLAEVSRAARSHQTRTQDQTRHLDSLGCHA